MRSRGKPNRKLVRLYGGNTLRVPDHLWHFYDEAERTVLKESGAVYRRPRAMHLHTLASHRCVTALRRGR